MSDGWVTRKKLKKKRGYTDGQIRGRVQRGRWRPGIEWADVDGSRLFNLDAIDARTSELAAVQRQPDDRQTKQRRRVVPLIPEGRLARLT